jgi:ELWxxDGT repeat protein
MARLLTAMLAAASLLLAVAVGSAPASAATSAVLVKDIAPGAAGSSPDGLTGVDGAVFFAANDGVHGDELWKSDGTTAGTTLVKDINPGAASSIGGGNCWYRYLFAAVNGTVFFAADDGVHGCELWESDGTAQGTSLVADINPGQAGSRPQSLIDFNGKLFFSADDGVHGREPWRSNGTSIGTHLVEDVVPGVVGDGFEQAIGVADTLFFIANDYEGDSHQLWRTDGTPAGTLYLAHLRCAQCDSDIDFVAAFNNLAIVIVYAGVGGTRAVYRSDGTPEGTYRFDLVTWATSAVFNGAFYYFDRAYSIGEGTTELKKTDGTVEGTTVVSDLGLPGMGPGPSAATVFGGRLLFFGNAYVPGGNMLSLWASDGSAGGTGPLFDIGPLGSPSSTTAVGGSLFFGAGIAGGGGGLWTTDGTAAGTYLVKDINPGEAYSSPWDLTAVDGTLFFIAEDGLHGRELWKTTPPVPTEPERSDYKNAADYCKALREFLGSAEFSQRYKNRGSCVKANH